MLFYLINLGDKLSDAELKIETLNTNLNELSRQKDVSDSMVSELEYMRDSYIKYQLAFKLFEQQNPKSAQEFYSIINDTIPQQNEQLHD
jgi:hypothetical protein